MTHIKGYEKAQRAWEVQEPPEWIEEAEEECSHKWRIFGRAKDGTTFYKCVYCGEEGEA
jgi:hypothetical protein